MKLVLSLLILLCVIQNIFSQCGNNQFTGALAESDYKGILDDHNQKRNDVAQGKEKGSGGSSLPKAANMNEMTWNADLAKMAQDWANNLVKKCSGLEHNSIRKCCGFSYVGENIASSGSSNKPSSTSAELVDASKRWYAEIKDFPVNIVGGFKSVGATIGHFTQNIWAKSKQIGCGYALYSKGGMYNTFVVCNYAPGGNMMGGSIYQEGDACSKCPSGTKCSTKWNGLCTSGSGGSPSPSPSPGGNSSPSPSPSPGGNSSPSPSPSPITNSSRLLGINTLVLLIIFFISYV